MNIFTYTKTNTDLFIEAAMLDLNRYNYGIQNKREGSVYALIEIVDCEQEDWWYKDFIGFQCYAEIRFANYGYGKFVKEAVLVAFKGKKILSGRSISAKDFIIL